MDIISQRNAQIACLQKNLSAVRKIAGWTSEQLGEKIGVTKQTISNLENEKTKMTLMCFARPFYTILQRKSTHLCA